MPLARCAPPVGLHPRLLLATPPSCHGPAVSSVPDLDALISVARNSGRLDLSNCGLTELPVEVLSLTGLVDLSLAGNTISHLPQEICKLKNLERLAVPGNQLQTLPESIGNLAQLRGLWLQGNLLQSLPSQLGNLHELQTLSLAGNQLQTITSDIRKLNNLRYLSLAGNQLIEFPEFGASSSLRVLALYGNLLRFLPDSIGKLALLEELWLQGNCLEALPEKLETLVSLKQFCASENRLTSLPASIGELGSLEVLSLYGNNIRKLPPSIEAMHQLLYLWLEGNPFETETLSNTLLPVNLKSLGLSVMNDQPLSTHQPFSLSHIAGTGRAGSFGGYFKLERYNESKDASVLVIAFGSAPAVPNWGGVLKKIKEMEIDNLVPPAYDVLYVVDSWRSWYTQNKQETAPDAKTGSYYRSELKMAAKNYKRVLMLGDSMGASGALLFSDLASSVVAFCPQVDLTTSVMRPGKETQWLEDYKEALLGAVSKSEARISVHCGNFWQDIAQVELLPKDKVTIKVHSHVDNHRLTKQLNSDDCLVSLIRDEIQHELSYV